MYTKAPLKAYKEYVKTFWGLIKIGFEFREVYTTCIKFVSL